MPQSPGDTGVDAETGPDNQAPSAEAGQNQFVPVGETVVLDASNSSDPDGDGLSYAWSIVSKPSSSSATLSSPDNVSSQFTADVGGEYVVEVAVSDATQTSTDRVTVDARPTPVAEAGPDQTGEVGTPVTLDGSASSAPGGHVLTYAWTFVSKPSGSGIDLTMASGPMVSFTPDADGSYIVELTVDNEAAQASDRATISVRPEGGRLTSTVYVSPEGDDGNRGTEEQPVKTLERGLEIAEDESMVSTVQLAAGTYDLGASTTTVSTDLDIAGPQSDSETATIQGPDETFDISGDHYVTFLDVTLESPGDAVSVGDDAGISFVNVTCRAERCITSGGLFVEDGGRVEVRRSELIGEGDSPKVGINMAVHDELSVVDSTIRGFPSQGINVLNGPVTVQGATLRDNGQGIQLVVNTSTNATLIDTTDFRSNETALKSLGAKNVTLRETTIESTTSDAVVVEEGAVQFQNSRIESVFGNGVLVNGGAVVTARDSEFIGNLLSGIRVNGAGARVNLGTASNMGGNRLENNVDMQLHDARPDGAGASITLSDTNVGGSQPPPGTYSGPNFDQYGIVIDGNNDVTVY